MPPTNKNFSQFIAEDGRRAGGPDEDLAAILDDIQRACMVIAALVSRGSLAPPAPLDTRVNAHGEEQKPFDVVTNDIMLRTCERSGQLAAMVSEELDEPYVPDIGRQQRGRYLLVFDPLDGSSNIDVNVTIGTIFSVLRMPPGAGAPTAAHFLQPGRQQVAAGFALYGPTTMLILTLGAGTHGFTLDRGLGTFVLTHPDMRIPETTREFAINASNERFWEPPVRRYVEECVEGAAGIRGVDFNMRWIASMVAEVHRVLVRGGLYMYPRDTKQPPKAGRLRLLYEASPAAFLIEQAGGGATTGRERLLDVTPREIHERAPVIVGSRREVERLVRYHEEYDRGEEPVFRTPLFNTRTLFQPDLQLPGASTCR